MEISLVLLVIHFIYVTYFILNQLNLVFDLYFEFYVIDFEVKFHYLNSILIFPLHLQKFLVFKFLKESGNRVALSFHML